MPTLDELRKKRSSSSTSGRLLSIQPTSSEPPSSSKPPFSQPNDSLGSPRPLSPMTNLDQLSPPPCKKSRKLILASSFFDDESEPPSSQPASSKPPSSQPNDNDNTNSEQPILHLQPPMPNLTHLHDHLDSLPPHEPSIHEPGVTSSTPETLVGFFPEFFPDLIPQNLPSPILSDKQKAAKLPFEKPNATQFSSAQPVSGKLPPSQLGSSTTPSSQHGSSTNPSSQHGSSKPTTFQLASSKPPPSDSQPTSTKPPSFQRASSKSPSNAPRRRRNRDAQNFMFQRRQKLTRSSHRQDVVTVDRYKLTAPVKRPKPWIPDLELTQTDRDTLLSSIAWVTDSIVNAAQSLLKKANPRMAGFQSVALGLTMSFDVEPGEFVQILHSGHGHWLTISTVGTQHPEVQVYDSMYTCCPTACKTQIASLLATNHSAIELKYMDVQMQSGGYDCGLFAIAFATALTYGSQPGLFLFDQEKMRRHLRKCFEDGQITPFPTKKKRRTAMRVKAVELVPVYCTCRMPELPGSKWLECSQCKEWYHVDTCTHVDAKYFDRKCKWFCHSCINS